MKIIDLINQRHQFIQYNNLAEETQTFLKTYGQFRKISLPKEEKYDRQLADTKSKARLRKDRENKLKTGISLVITSFIFLFISASIKTSSLKKLFDFVSVPAFFVGGTVVLVQITQKSKYNDSNAAKKARSIKRVNEINIKQFYISTLDTIALDYQQHISFLNTNPNLEQISEYKLANCKISVEREFFEQVIKERIQIIQQEEAAQALFKTVNSVAKLGMQLAEINELNEIGNALNDLI